MYRYLDAALERAAPWSAPAQTEDWPRLTGPLATTTSWREWLKRVWQMPGFAAALEVASPDLARRVEQIMSGRSTTDRAARRAVIAMMFYLLRARTRATPFGLLAGVAAARIGDQLDLRVGIAHRATAAPDAHWTAALIDHLEQQLTVQPHLMLRASNLVIEYGGRLLIEHRPARTGAPDAVEIRATGPARAALAAADAPIRWADLAAKLAGDFPAAPTGAIETLLTTLVDHRFLLTDLHPAMTAIDTLTVVADTLAGPAPTEATALREIAVALNRHYAVASPEAGHRERAAAKALMSDLVPDTPAALAVGLRLDWDLTIPHAVAAEAAAAATALVRLARRPALNSGWTAWHAAFLDRYGPGAVVPVQEAVDASTGIGFPSGYLGSAAAATTGPIDERDGQLLRLAQGAATRGQTIVELDDDQIEKLSGIAPGDPIQPSTELTIRIHARDPQALERGEFLLHIVGVARSAGATAGRFLRFMDVADRTRMTRIYANLPAAHEGALLAQLSAPPLYVSAENVARAPQATRLAISIGEYHDEQTDVLDLTDLAVTADARTLHLVSRSRKRPVHTLLLSAVDLAYHSHPMTRFLAEAPVALCAPCAGFQWGAASALPFLPALRYGRTILSPARWLLTTGDLSAAGAPWPTWDQALATWRAAVRLPQHVYLGDGDQCVSIDLDVEAHRVLLRTQLERENHATLRTAPDPSDLGWAGGHAHEIVIPLAATTAPAAAVRRPMRATSRDRIHLPGCDDRVYLHLHGRRDRQNAVLVEHVPQLIKQLSPERWWFVRYRDPRDHLRLRLILPPGALGDAAAQIGAWTRRVRDAGLIARASWETHYPETARFGGPAAIEAAEEYFAADSAAAIAQLTTQRRGPDLRAVLAASMADIAIALVGETGAAMCWLIDRTRTEATAPQRALYDQALALTAGEAPLDRRVSASWSKRRTALTAYRAALRAEAIPAQDLLADLLHLHHARVVGPDLQQERAALHLVRAAALSWSARSASKP